MVNGYNKNSLNSLLLVRFDLIKEQSRAGQTPVARRRAGSMKTYLVIIVRPNFVCAKRKPKRRAGRQAGSVSRESNG